MRRIAVLTSGGDAPGMNAAVRAVVRTGIDRGLEVWGVRNGYQGLIEGAVAALGARDVGGILGRGGTVLGSARSPELKTDAGVAKVVGVLERHDIEAVVVVGGGGSQAGALTLSGRGIPIVGVASTIDNDLPGSDVTIGVDTALNLAVEAIDRLRVTASSHRRAVLVEVMGRDCGYLGLMAGIAGGAETICIPEVPTDPEAVADEICQAYERGKPHALVVIAEGAAYDAAGLARYFQEHDERLGFEVRRPSWATCARRSDHRRPAARRDSRQAPSTPSRAAHGVLCGMIDGRVVTRAARGRRRRSKPLPATISTWRVSQR
jgi:6-phosphofructokinase 1